MSEHVCTKQHPRAVFCECGRVVDREGLDGIGIHRFAGRFSMSPRVERFWDTANPDVLKDSFPLSRKVQEDFEPAPQDP